MNYKIVKVGLLFFLTYFLNQDFQINKKHRFNIDFYPKICYIVIYPDKTIFLFDFRFLFIIIIIKLFLYDANYELHCFIIFH